MTLLKPELWLNRLQQLSRICSPRPTKLWPTAGLRRQLCTWKERLSRHSAGLTIPPSMTAVLVSRTLIFSDFLIPLSFSRPHSHSFHRSCGQTLCVHVALHCTRHSTLSPHCNLLVLARPALKPGHRLYKFTKEP